MTRDTKRRRGRLPRYVRAHGSGFRAAVTIQGEVRRSPTFRTIDEASAWAAQAVEFRSSGRPVAITFAVAFELLFRDLDETGASDATVDYYATHRDALVAGFGGEARHLHEITPDDVRAFVAKRRADGVSATTIVEKQLGILKRLVRLAQRHGYPMPRDPFEGVRLPKVVKRQKDFLTPAQIARLLDLMRASDRPLAGFWADVFEFCFGTGMRIGGLLRLRVRDIDLDRGFVRIVDKSGERQQTFARDLEPAIRGMVAGAHGPGDRIFRTKDSIDYQCRAWRKRAQLPALSIHVLRHSFATAMAERVSPWRLMGLMGHTNLKQTARYYHATGSDVRDALSSLLPGRPSPPAP